MSRWRSLGACLSVALASVPPLGVHSFLGRTVPPSPHRGVDVRQLAGGGYAAYVLGTDGAVWAWGDDLEGQLGNGTSGSAAPVPLRVRRLPRAVAVAASANSAYALQQNGTVWAWGDNSTGELGPGRAALFNGHPGVVRTLHSVVAIAAGDFSAYALRRDGTLWAWGNNAFGEIAQPLRMESSDVPLRVRHLSDVVSVSAGASSAYALRRDGSVWGWGSNALGQLARPSWLVARAVPLRIVPLAQVVAITASASSGFALRPNGTVWAWGDGSYGQLGTGNCLQSGANQCAESADPRRVRGLRNVVAIAAGANSAYALEANGTEWAWGDGRYGQLGDASTASSDVPVRVRGIADVVAIAAGGTAAYALGASGRVWAWGDNAYGQLGNAAAGNSVLPVTVRMPREEQ